jgi:hypothetical protein
MGTVIHDKHISATRNMLNLIQNLIANYVTAEDDGTDNIKAIITLMENIKVVRKFFDRITLYRPLEQFGHIKWEFTGVSYNIYSPVRFNL